MNQEEKELREVNKEISRLKKKYEHKLKLTTSITERNDLLRKIAQLDEVKKKPSLFANFGKTFSRGLKMTGKSLFKATVKGSRNLSKNSPEFNELSKKKESYKQPYSNLVQSQYFPHSEMPMPSGHMQSYPMPRKLSKKQLKKLNKKMRMVRPMPVQEQPFQLP